MADPVQTPDPNSPAPSAAGTAAGAPPSPPVPAATPPAEASATPPAADPPVQEPKAPKPGTPSPEPQGKAAEDWREARLRVETAKRREAEAKLREAEAKLNTQVVQQPSQQPTTPVAVPPAVTEAEIDRRANERAAQQAQWQAFNSACNDAATAGKATYPDFDSRVAELRKLADPQDPVSMASYNGFLAAALETGEAPKLIHALGGDLNEAQRIMSLPPLKMAVELTKLASKPEAQISKAPKPITPLTPHGGSRDAIDPADKERSDGLSTRAWMERREAQLAAKEQRR